MGADVYANGDAIACKAGDAKVIASFPDVCLSPPSPPAGPVPLPYPNTSFDKDMQSGSKTVMIKGDEVMLKDQSFYQTSPLGDEAATNGLGAGVMTGCITGKTYFVLWSMDVQFEGANVDRHTDLTTSNHASPMANNNTPNGSMSEPAKGSSGPDQDLCECCGKPRHASQKGAPPVSEDKWYGLDEQVPEDPPQPHPLNKRGMKEWAEQCQALKERREKLNNRKRRVAEAKRKKCQSLPQPPCNVYRVITAEQTAQAEEEWGAAAADYKANHKVPFVKGGSRGPVAHRTPKSAGGCPTGEGNLAPNNEMSKECQDADAELTKVQSDCAANWQSGAWTV